MIINKVRESEPGVGFDAYKEEYVDMVSEGILDPAKVTRSALQNATSVASTLLTTESVVATIKEDDTGYAGRRCRRNGNDVKIVSNHIIVYRRSVGISYRPLKNEN